MKCFSYCLLLLCGLLLFSPPSFAAKITKETVTVSLFAVDQDGIGESVGNLTMYDTVRGLVIKPKLKNIPPGVHGFHLHDNPDCSPALNDGVMTAAQSAGGHYDPEDTNMHHGPNSDGHRGDLPALKANAAGHVDGAILVPQLKLEDIKGRAFVIHAGGDNYSDTPLALGGGGARIACGVVN